MDHFSMWEIKGALILNRLRQNLSRNRVILIYVGQKSSSRII